MIVYDTNETPVDDGRMLTIDINQFDIKKLADIYKEISEEEQRHPWKFPENYTGWKRSGWYYPEVDHRHEHSPGVFESNTKFQINNYSYITDICDTLKEEFETIGVWYFHNLKDYSFMIHYDLGKPQEDKTFSANSAKTADGVSVNAPNRGQRDGKLLPGWPTDYAIKKSKGSITSFNIICSEHWSNDTNPTPVCFTRENQNHLPFKDMYKTDDDFVYYYKAGLLNTHWTHYLDMDGVHERLLFRVSIYDDIPFEAAKNKFKKLGLINN